MKKKYSVILTATCLLVLSVLQNKAWAAVTIQPAFKCSQAKTSEENLICKKNSTLSYYDAILNTLYDTLKSILPPKQFQALEQEQRQWLAHKKAAYYKNLKSDSNVDDAVALETGWYADRLSDLSIRYKDFLQPYYLNALAQGKISSNLKYAFMWFFYTDYDMSKSYAETVESIKESQTDSMVCGTEGCGQPWLDLTSKFTLLKISPDHYIIAGQFNEIGDIVNLDGGVYSFYWVQPNQNKITLLNIQQDANSGYDSTVQTSDVLFDPIKKQIVMVSRGNKSYYSINLEKMQLDFIQ
jgi:uncharacterized protein